MLRKLSLLLFILLAFSLSVFAQNKSVYTDLSDKKCKTLESDSSGAGSYIGECVGVGGFKLQVLEGDLRQTINVVSPKKRKFELNFWSYYSSFSSVGEKAEWRMKGKVPVGLIVRYNVSDPEDSTKTTSYLMVAKITKTSACIVDIIKPSKNQNEEAQKAADSADTKPCKNAE